jgi:hypothetical protein
LNLHGFPKIECCQENWTLSFTFYGGNIEHGARAWSLLIFGWFSRLSLDNDHLGIQV